MPSSKAISKIFLGAYTRRDRSPSADENASKIAIEHLASLFSKKKYQCSISNLITNGSSKDKILTQLELLFDKMKKDSIVVYCSYTHGDHGGISQTCNIPFRLDGHPLINLAHCYHNFQPPHPPKQLLQYLNKTCYGKKQLGGSAAKPVYFSGAIKTSDEFWGRLNDKMNPQLNTIPIKFLSDFHRNKISQDLYTKLKQFYQELSPPEKLHLHKVPNDIEQWILNDDNKVYYCIIYDKTIKATLSIGRLPANIYAEVLTNKQGQILNSSKLSGERMLFDIFGHFRFAINKEQNFPIPGVYNDEASKLLLLKDIYDVNQSYFLDVDFLSLLTQKVAQKKPKLIILLITACHSGKIVENIQLLNNALQKNDTSVIECFQPITQIETKNSELIIKRKKISISNLKALLKKLVIICSVPGDFSDAGIEISHNIKLKLAKHKSKGIDPLHYRSGLFTALAYALENKEYQFLNYPLKCGQTIKIDKPSHGQLFDFLQQVSFDINYPRKVAGYFEKSLLIPVYYCPQTLSREKTPLGIDPIIPKKEDFKRDSSGSKKPELKNRKGFERQQERAKKPKSENRKASR